MTALHAEQPQLEANTINAMTRVVNTFAALTDKTLTVEEGYQFLSLWGMVNKTAAAVTVMMQAPEQVAVEASAPVVPPVPAISPAAPEVNVVSTSASALLKEVTSAPAAEKMPQVEEISVEGMANPMRRIVSSFRTPEKNWRPGFNWRIDVIPFDVDSHDEAYFVHFRERPTQAEFDEHYARFTDKENRCKVHVMESNGFSSTRITDEFCSFTERSGINYGTPEIMKPRTEWQEGERFRIKFWDQRINSMNYQYFPNKPARHLVTELSTIKRVAIVEPRPKNL
ncbi:hypothetical protein [Pantoea sp. CCBC3-3-1]|uniref:hypothetical protein n=1 Tax=Pantoea sp. CCBC3-3-1 TaxID=2490851 RepID=UPI0011BF2708|nr:hypothetical protein [Pantoea sp. CCBC3-3-1]